MEEWVRTILSVAGEADNFNKSPDSFKQCCVKLFCSGVNIGIIKPQILLDLINFKDVFVVEGDGSEIKSIKISENLTTIEERSVAINGVFKDLQVFPDRYPCLKGWRNENYAVGEYFNKPVLFHCERAGARLLGIKQYGVHINGYIKMKHGEYKLWIGKRSLTKPTYPGMLDNMVAGGIEAGNTVFQTLIKECHEEASISFKLAQKAQPTGTISSYQTVNKDVKFITYSSSTLKNYCHETVDGILPETEFVYDLELPDDFIPVPRDGEVSQFYLWNIEKIKNEIAKNNFKPNCALVLLQFLLRHGIVTPDEEAEYVRLASCCHVQLFDI